MKNGVFLLFILGVVLCASKTFSYSDDDFGESENEPTTESGPTMIKIGKFKRSKISEKNTKINYCARLRKFFPLKLFFYKTCSCCKFYLQQS